MEKLIDKDSENFFLSLAQKGVKLPYDFDIDQLKKDQHQDDPMHIMTRQVKAFQEQIDTMKKAAEPKAFSIEALCHFPFDKSLTMVSFPFNTIFPKYDKYMGKIDPQDHLREFCALSIEFMHNDTYIMRLFPRSLGGPVMEWFSKLTPR